MPQIKMVEYGPETLYADTASVVEQASAVARWYAELARVAELLVADGWRIDACEDDHCQYVSAEGRAREGFDLEALKAKYASDMIEWMIYVDGEEVSST